MDIVTFDTAMCVAVHSGNVKKGFYDEPVHFYRVKNLIVSELMEADESMRKNRVTCPKGVTVDQYDELVKGTVQEEMADVLIRIMDAIGYYSLDLPTTSVTHYHIVQKVNDFDTMFNYVCQYILGMEVAQSDFRIAFFIAKDLALRFMTIEELKYHIALKLEYNKKRPYKHGKVF